MPTVLLHMCCGVCSSGAIQRLLDDGYSVTGFFYNPNIYPEDEYRKRLAAAGAAGKILNIETVVGEYDRKKWDERVKGLEGDPEGGGRCIQCFRMRLEETYKKAGELGFSYIASTLSISPHKNCEVINQIGRSIAQDVFLPYNFKKQDGFKKASDFSKLHNLYRQNYCGCVYSIRV
ncbi:MAG: epoxyqueuosine reductase QueH [Candidatus Omnitrophica bacterium]|nr:epoxyqueuosine reductase QueH [Candidatus Omnitrophota bacterium]